MTPLQHHEKRLKHGMSEHAELLLELVKNMMADGLTREMMACNHLAVYHQLGSSSTMHKAMQFLVDSGYISVDKTDRDARARACTVTRKGLNYLADDQNKEN